MTANVAIDVVLGLVFVFLLYSMLASILQEIIAKWLGLRARNLLKAIRRMLQDDDGPGFTLPAFFIEIWKNVADYLRPLRKDTFLKAFYDNPTIKYLGENTSSSKPSYIEEATFSRTVIQLLRGEGYGHTFNQMQAIRASLDAGGTDGFRIDPQTLKHLRGLWIDSDNDLGRFQYNLEEWYNNTMNRASGWYKKQTRLILGLIGFLLAWNFNVDAIAIGRILASEDGIRKEITDFALARKDHYAEINRREITATPLGGHEEQATHSDSFSHTRLDTIAGELQTDALALQSILGLGSRDDMNSALRAKYQDDAFTAFFGWIMTALAISMGAPFWFDLLNKVMSLRTAGPRPAGDETARKGTSYYPIRPVG